MVIAVTKSWTESFAPPIDKMTFSIHASKQQAGAA
jgi:hypothetical protein